MLTSPNQTDDLSDEGDLQSKPEAVDAGHHISRSVITDPDNPRPEYPYAAMLYEWVFPSHHDSMT